VIIANTRTENNNLSSRSSSPIYNSVNAIEIWLLFCLLMTFLAALQTIFTLKHRSKPYTTQYLIPSCPPPTPIHSLPAHETNKQTIMGNTSPKRKDNFRQSTASSSASIVQHLETFKDLKQVRG
jgi:hypothetical protein